MNGRRKMDHRRAYFQFLDNQSEYGQLGTERDAGRSLGRSYKFHYLSKACQQKYDGSYGISFRSLAEPAEQEFDGLAEIQDCFR